MKKLIFLFDQPKSTILLVDTDSNDSSRNEIDSDLLFLEPSKFPSRLMDIAFNNKKIEKLENILFVFDGELDKLNGVLLFNETLNYISYKETYNLYDLRSKFASYVVDSKEIKLLSNLDFYSTLIDNKKIQYPSLLLHLGNSVSVELAFDKAIRTNLNADIEFIPTGSKYKSATELLSNNFLMKNSDYDLTNSFTNNLKKVILFFMSIVQDRNQTINSIQIISNRTELINNEILSDGLKTNFTVHGNKNLLLEIESLLKNKDYNFLTLQDIISDPLRNIPMIFAYLINPFIPFAGKAIQKISKKRITEEKLEDIVNRIEKILLKTGNDEVIKEFAGVDDLEKYFEQTSEILDPNSKVEFIDSNNRVVSYSLAELKNISVFSNMKMKITSSFHPLIGESLNTKLLLKK